MNFADEVDLFSYLFSSLTCRKILRHATYGFTPLPKDVVLRILSLLKIRCPRPGLDPRSTLTTSPPRATVICVIQTQFLPVVGKENYLF
jgi:hypothetical protein